MDPFLIRLVLSFITGFIWITLLTILAERYGTKIGGAIAGIPATMVVALLFIGITQSPEIASESTIVVPLVVGMNALFTVIYIFFARHTNFSLSLIGSLAIWSSLSFLLLLSKWNNFIWSLIGYILLVLVSYYFLEKKFKIISQGKRALKYSTLQLLFRGIVGGTLILLAVLMTKIGGPLLGGIFASFPVLTVAMIIITRIGHDPSYTESLLKNFIIAGTINVVIFVIIIRYTYPTLGLFWGTLLSLVISLIASYFGYKLINKRMS